MFVNGPALNGRQDITRAVEQCSTWRCGYLTGSFLSIFGAIHFSLPTP
jgi:hypothetical protein